MCALTGGAQRYMRLVHAAEYLSCSSPSLSLSLHLALRWETLHALYGVFFLSMGPECCNGDGAGQKGQRQGAGRSMC